MAAEGEQPRVVARYKNLERRLLPATGQLDQALVAREPKQGRRSAKSGQRLLSECVALHRDQS
jgi:hypothetical protein